jgi:prepilin-type N-terminal cleavage/methylation domain-containing protein
MNRRKPHARPAVLRRAYTLIELVASIVVIGIMSGVASGLLMRAVEGDRACAARAQLTWEASMALDRAQRELKHIARHADGGAAIDALSPTAIQWDALNSLSLNADELTLTAPDNPPVTLLSDVTAFTLAAFSADGTAIALPIAGDACRDVRRLSITIAADRNGAAVTLRTRIFVRAGLEATP